MIPRLRSAVVLGAGTMGAQLACLLAATGARVRLLDVDGDVAARGLERASKLKPSPLQEPRHLLRIVPGGFEELEAAAAGADWILEAVVEQLEPKRALLQRVDAATGGDDGPLVSTNTSGLSVGALADGRSGGFRRRFLGTHFFNPPRYARLLELVPTADTDSDRLGWIESFGSRALGKATVRAKDTPAFIANRLGVHGMLTALDLATSLGLGVDEVDELTGPLIGRPKSATFRTLDLVGLDVAVAVADHCHADLVDDPERDRFTVPAILRSLVEGGRLGEKSGAGFYRRVDGEILALDTATGDYRPRRKVASAAVEQLRAEPDLRRRLGLALTAADRAPSDPAACFLRQLLAAGLVYAATVGPDIADDAGSVDRAIRYGFGWEIGPFETWDVLGPDRVAASSGAVPGLVERIRTEGGTFRDDGAWLDFRTMTHVRPSAEAANGTAGRGGVTGDSAGSTAPLTAGRTALPANAAATLVDLGDGILGLRLHARHSVIGLDTVDLVIRGAEIAAASYDGFVIGTDLPDLSLGANAALLLMEADDGEWDELDRAVRRFQAATRAIRYAAVPVVVAPRGRTLGGGVELCLAADRCQALAETYIGLVEAGIGLIPAGGGTTSMARRVSEALPEGVPGDAFPFFRHALETMAMARVATSAEEARSLGLLRPADLVTADPDRQWADSKATARLLAEVGYRPPLETPIRVLGRRGIASATALTWNELNARHMSAHDRTVTLALAGVLAGGDIAEGTPVAEGYLLDLEREAFLRLLGERLTRDRIRHTLRTGKPLRN